MLDTNLLIERWCDGDERAAEALYNHYQADIFRLAYGILRNWIEAEDVMQETLIYALNKIHNYDPTRASFRTWLSVITVSRCRDRQRRRRPLLSLSMWFSEDDDVDVAETATPYEEQVIRDETSSEVWTAVQTLSPRLREAILLRYWGGYTYREMADILKCPIRTAQSRVRLAYRNLSDALAASKSTNLIQLEGGVADE
jgi:RNA polymerase sigma-70 factor (ECF subfamily)